MRVALKSSLISLIIENDNDAEVARGFLTEARDHVFLVGGMGDGSRFVVLRDLGLRAEACREPIDLSSHNLSEDWELIRNAAHTPFELHGEPYACVAGFWHGLRFPAEADRRRLASLHGAEVERAGQKAPRRQRLVYRGRTLRVASEEHWALMRDACFAKFSQSEQAKTALLSTGGRPLADSLVRDGAMPGCVMDSILMNIRSEFQAVHLPRGVYVGFDQKAFDAGMFEAARSAGKPILVEVTSSSCPISRVQFRILMELASVRKLRKLAIFEIDYDTQKDALRALGVERPGTLICFRGRREVGRLTGEINPRPIRDLLNKAFLERT